MNATGDSEENPELLTSGMPGMPLSAPVAAGTLPARELSVFFREPDDAAHLDAGLSRPPVPSQPGGFPLRTPAPVPPGAAPPPHVHPAGLSAARPRHEVIQPGLAKHASVPPERAHTPTVPAQDGLAGIPAQDRASAPEQVAAPAPPSSGAVPGRHGVAGRQGRAESVTADWSPDDPPEDPNRVLIRKHLDAVRVSAASASSWLETSVHYARLLNRDDVVPVTAKFSREDIEFLGRAREQVLGFAELGLRLLELHAPLDAGGISTDPSSPILRCRSCMWRWPCPTFRMLAEALSHLPAPGSPPSL